VKAGQPIRIDNAVTWKDNDTMHNQMTFYSQEDKKLTSMSFDAGWKSVRNPIAGSRSTYMLGSRFLRRLGDGSIARLSLFRLLVAQNGH
jgi:hypothetical protein